MRIKTMASLAILTLSSAALASGLGGGQAANNMAMGNMALDNMADDMPAADNSAVPPIDTADNATTAPTPDSGADDAPPK